MLDADTDAIMHARYIADQVRLGKRTLSTKERSALAMGFDACDRQRAEFARAKQDAEAKVEELQARRAADLTSEEREALASCRVRSRMARFEASAMGIDLGALDAEIAVLDRLLATRKP